jgi:indole-3-glycerol phosphate synthase
LTSAAESGWPARRFSQAISEGDGISVIPVVRGGTAELASRAEAAGAEAIALQSVGEVRALRAQTELPLLLRAPTTSVVALREARAAGADACVLVWSELERDDELLGELVAAADDLGLDWALEVADEDELEEALEYLDPEILVLRERERDEDDDELELTLDLLGDVPAGKLVVSDALVTTREDVLAIESAGVDAVLVGGTFTLAGGLAAALAELTGR